MLMNLKQRKNKNQLQHIYYLDACHQKGLGLAYGKPHSHVPPTLQS